MRKYHVSAFILMLLLIFISAEAYPQKDKRKQKGTRIDTLNFVVADGKQVIEITFLEGESFNHPTFAIWIEDDQGRYIETLFVTEYFATGIFAHGDAGNGTWKADKGESLRPAALPYWSHKRNILSRDSLYIPTAENPVTDAVTGATPAGSFVMMTSSKKEIANKCVVLFEINQTWDWNEYWTNNKYPDDNDYKSSAQPSVVYAGVIDSNASDKNIILEPIGHGHYSGKDGSLTQDLSTMTTALDIVSQITVSISN